MLAELHREDGEGEVSGDDMQAVGKKMWKFDVYTTNGGLHVVEAEDFVHRDNGAVTFVRSTVHEGAKVWENVATFAPTAWVSVTPHEEKPVSADEDGPGASQDVAGNLRSAAHAVTRILESRINDYRAQGARATTRTERDFMEQRADEALECLNLLKQEGYACDEDDLVCFPSGTPKLVRASDITEVLEKRIKLYEQGLRASDSPTRTASTYMHDEAQAALISLREAGLAL